MQIGLLNGAPVLLLAFLLSLQGAYGIRFVIDREECFSHNVLYEGDTVHISFVVIKVDASWHYTQDGVDLVVKGFSGEQLHDFRDRTSEKIEFVAHQKGVHQFCFINKFTFCVVSLNGSLGCPESDSLTASARILHLTIQ